jgi:hypothetical protein
MHYLQALPSSLKVSAIALMGLLRSALAHVSPEWPTVHDAPETIEAVAVAVLLDEEAPVFDTHEEDGVVMLDWARQESAFVKHARGDHHPVRGYLSHGLWQLRTRAGLSESALVQARAELSMLHEGKKMCPASPASVLWGGCHVLVTAFREYSDILADRRIARAKALYVSALGFD